MLRLSSVAAVSFALIAATTVPVRAQINPDEVEIKTVPVAPGIHMLVGAGGNIGVSSGEDGVFLIDDQYAPLTEKIRAAVSAIRDEPIRFVLNTHWHPDHTGGNENLGQVGALIVAHENVRTRMSSEQVLSLFNMTVPASPEGALPVVTFTDAVTFHLNGQEIHAFHVAPAHTDGDSIVHFKNADVIHAGDLYFNGGYPVIDVDADGSIDGILAAADRLLDISTDTTKIIPGHGPLSNRAELAAYRAMLQGVRDAIAALVAEGKTLEEVQAAAPTAPWDEKWGEGFVDGPTFTKTAYTSLTKH